MTIWYKLQLYLLLGEIKHKINHMIEGITSFDK